MTPAYVFELSEYRWALLQTSFKLEMHEVRCPTPPLSAVTQRRNSVRVSLSFVSSGSMTSDAFSQRLAPLLLHPSRTPER